MLWARMLAYITGTVDQELLLRNELCLAKTRSTREMNDIRGRSRDKLHRRHSTAAEF
jgi:hypothetical protein